MDKAEYIQAVKERFPDKMARLKGGFYQVKNEDGEKVPFCLRPIQEDFLNNRHGFDLVLKARQLGFTTAIQIDMLDDCLFSRNINAGIVAHNKDDAEAFFDDKIKFAYDNLPELLKEHFASEWGAEQDSAKSLKFANGSRIRVGTSLRSGTLQRLHISEYGKVCAKYPEKAREIQTGALNTVHIGHRITIESTAEGQGGHFYDMCQEAQSIVQAGRSLSPIDFKFHFYPWWEDRKYELDPEHAFITSEMEAYFDRLERRDKVELSDGQKAWYVRKRVTQQDDMKLEFPSTSGEAFEAAVEGAYFAKEMEKSRMRGNVCHVPFRDDLPVDTFWDLGIGDKMCIWFFQLDRGRPCMIDYYENHSEGLTHYVEVLSDKPYMYGRHYLPHDGKNRTFVTGEPRDAILYRMMRIPVTVVQRTLDVTADIQTMRSVIPIVKFDIERCQTGLKHLGNYRRKWDDKRGTWLPKPLHNDASNGVDALRTFAVSWQRGIVEDFEHSNYDEEEENYEYEGRNVVTGY